MNTPPRKVQPGAKSDRARFLSGARYYLRAARAFRQDGQRAMADWALGSAAVQRRRATEAV